MSLLAPRPLVRPIVLVHGAWGGAWIWKRVLAPLRAAGHEVHAVTLTGDGERAHLRHARIGLADHIRDVVAGVQAEELQHVLLVGHSYGGMVITGAADALLDTAPASVDALVYVDAMVPLPGEGWGHGHSPALQAERRAAAAKHDNALPPADPEGFGLTGADRDWLLRRQVPHPFGPYGEPLQFNGERWAALPRHFIDCHEPAYPTIEPSRQRVRSLPNWQLHRLATGHCPMVSAPAALAALLLEVAADPAGLGPAGAEGADPAS
ncbi:putative hydrolase or acyltransferase of alpha/beta superfamily [Burkholderiales bacterium JOSHI_001]|nr:putative hydrolase or acyltransferase of alpha/beta superfamily [Burkholderiales bacterium JOSHI_001]